MAIIAGVLVSLIIYLNRTARPGINSIVPDAADPARRSIVRKAGEAECPQLRILRIEGSLYFGAVNHVAEYLTYLSEARPDIKHLLITGKRMNFIDIAGAELLAAEARKRRAAGGGLYLYGLSERAQRFMEQPPFSDDIGANAIFATKKDAIAGIVDRLDMNVCANCKARIFNECVALPAPK
jgi:SulP family sulfate permease